MADLKVEFPNPCSEKWEQMAPRGCNRHCASCDKIIHDLSALTFDGAAALLDTDDEVCLRARIGCDGVIALKSSGGATARRMVAAAVATLALATAACETVPEETPPLFSISGQINNLYARKVVLSSEASKKRRPTLNRASGQFEFRNLKPGTYTLYVTGECGYYASIPMIALVNGSVTVTEDDFQDNEESGGCPIIVGVIRPVVSPELA